MAVRNVVFLAFVVASNESLVTTAVGRAGTTAVTLPAKCLLFVVLLILFWGEAIKWLPGYFRRTSGSVLK